MFEGQIMVDIYNTNKHEATRAIKQVSLPFQPYEGMQFDTGLGAYSIDKLEWSLEYSTFTAQVYLSAHEHSIDYAHEFEINGWQISTFEPVEGYNQLFLQQHTHPIPEIIECDACNGTGEGGVVQSLLGSASSVCQRCHGHGKIKKAW